MKNRRLERAYEHVNKLWFPVNDSIVERIRSGLESGAYDLDPDLIINELKKDFALFTFCLREMLVLLTRQQREIPADGSPADILRMGGIEGFKKIFNHDLSQISQHNLRNVEELQMKRLSEAFISATTAQTVSQKLELDDEFAFSAGLLRQLGITLIAWNYPTVYKRVTNSLEDNVSIDDSFAAALGFSPTMLAVTLAQRWGLSSAVRSIMGDASAHREHSRDVEEISETFSELCEVGEALARANDPQSYPSAAHDWKHAEQFLMEHIGPNALQSIEVEVRKTCEEYVRAAPKVLDRQLALRPAARRKALKRAELQESNPYVQGCPAELRNKLEDLYADLSGGEVCRVSIQTLIKHIIPSVGFSSGLVYLVDPASKRLIPRASIGKLSISQMNAIGITSSGDFMDYIDTAYRCKIPLTEHSVLRGSERYCCMMAGIADEKRVGVLYLEIPERHLSDSELDFCHLFKAFRQTLIDCLNLY